MLARRFTIVALVIVVLGLFFARFVQAERYHRRTDGRLAICAMGPAAACGFGNR